MSKPSVVITSIYPPSEAVKKIAKQGLDLIVVGDRKTPSDWSYDGVNFLSIDKQADMSYTMNRLLPFNHYGRKMVGYLEAMRLGANVIMDTDDDNIPKADWKFPDFDGLYENSMEDEGFINVYSYFSSQHIWPRGLPLDRIKVTASETSEKPSQVGIWQALADSDPDVDAIYRLVSNEPCTFNKNEPLVLAQGTLSPFNSQNTAFRKELFPLLYLPAYVTFRFTDILRGWVAQPILWAAGYSLGFTEATVVQERNPHDYLKDFESEIPCYLHSDKVIQSVERVVSPKNTIKDNLRLAYSELQSEGIVTEEELNLLEAWINDISLLGI